MSYLDRGQAALRLVCCIELDTVTPAFFIYLAALRLRVLHLGI